MSLREELEARERAFWAAAGEPGQYRRWFADDGVVIVPGAGEALDKAATIDAVARAEPWETFTLDDVACVELAADVAVLTYRGAGVRPGQSYEAMVSSVYVQRAGG